MVIVDCSAHLLPGSQQNNCILVAWSGYVDVCDVKKQKDKQARFNNNDFYCQHIYLLFNFYNLGFLLSKNLWLSVRYSRPIFSTASFAHYCRFIFWSKKPAAVIQ